MIQINPNQILPPDISTIAEFLSVAGERVAVRHLTNGEWAVPYEYSAKAPTWEAGTLRRMCRAEYLGGAA